MLERWKPTPTPAEIHETVGPIAYQLHESWDENPRTGWLTIGITRRDADEAKMSMDRWNEESSNTRRWTGALWAGEAFERIFERWALSAGVPLELGTHYAHADFGVLDLPLEVKARVGRAAPDRCALFPDQHMDRIRGRRGGLFFGVIEAADDPCRRQAVLLGGISYEDFVARARHVGPGDCLDGGQGAPAQNPCWEVSPRELIPPLRWAAAVSRAAAA